MNKAFVSFWFFTFLWALFLEIPLYVLAHEKNKRWRALFASILGNTITHPALWFFWPRFFSASIALSIGEFFAIIVEALCLFFLRASTLKKTFLIALCINLYSWFLTEYLYRQWLPKYMHYMFGFTLN
jgi:hypothetical protein